MKLFKKKKTVKTRYIVLPALFLFVLIHLFFHAPVELPAQKGRWTAITHDKTNFPLVGKHRAVPCADCHVKGVMQGTPTDCEACHWHRKQDDRYRLQLGIHCGDCHTPFDWKIVKSNAWEHERVTGFRLEGAHKTMDCFQCHKNNMLTRRPDDCYACHQEEYREVLDPNHTAAVFPTDCTVCHRGMVTWESAVFNHSAFVLRGGHKTTGCSDCHVNGVYAGTPSECVDCHRDDYTTTTNPNHQQAGYSTDCENCHGSGAVTWQGAVSDHSVFPLRGKHKTTACADCHTNGVYTGTPSQCVDCHQDDYNGTTDPNHQQAGFPTDCVPCHGSDAVTWENATFDHNQYWPLQGAHRTLDCSACHSAGYDLPRNCYGCHKADYDNTRDPNHVSAGFPTTCESCHFSSHVTWNQAVFNHNFPIDSGDHGNFACTDCHLTANYVQFSCIDCHEHNKNDMDDKHNDVSGYSYNSQACYTCHPRGTED